MSEIGVQKATLLINLPVWQAPHSKRMVKLARPGLELVIYPQWADGFVQVECPGGVVGWAQLTEAHVGPEVSLVPVNVEVKDEPVVTRRRRKATGESPAVETWGSRRLPESVKRQRHRARTATRRQELYAYLVSFARETAGSSPNYRQIGRATSLANWTTIRTYLEMLQEEGRILIVGKTRANHIIITGATWLAPGEDRWERFQSAVRAALAERSHLGHPCLFCGRGHFDVEVGDCPRSLACDSPEGVL